MNERLLKEIGCTSSVVTRKCEEASWSLILAVKVLKFEMKSYAFMLFWFFLVFYYPQPPLSGDMFDALLKFLPFFLLGN